MAPRILIAEDSPTQAERLRLLLEDQGYRVEVVTDGRDGLERVRSEPPDLVISDVLMPVMDGQAFCQALKSQEATRRIPFIFFTERHSPKDIVEGLLHGADNFIPKSASDEYLLERVRRIFEQLEHRRKGHLQVEILVRVGGAEIPISTDKQQIFELLISTLEETARANEKLKEAQQLLAEHARDLETKVEQRTRELRRAERRYHSLVECASDGIAVLDTSGSVLEVNQQMERLLSLPRRDLVGRHFTDFVWPEEREESRVRFDELLREGSARRDNRRLLRADGRPVPIDLSASVVDLGDEKVVLGIARDVTERQRAEAALRESQNLLQAILDSTPAAIHVRDLQGRYILVNREYESRHRAPRDQVTGRLPDAIFPGEEAATLVATDRQVVEAREPLEEEEVVRKEDGLHSYISIRFPLFDSGGAPYAVCGIATDITERKRLEAQLRQAQKMEAIGQLAGGVAHDFNNLLGVITGYSELVLKTLGPKHPQERHMLEIRRAAERAARLTRQLLAFSRKQVLQPRVLDLNAVVRETERMLVRLIGEDIQLVATLAPDLGRVRVDPGQIEQVIVNLAVNARDAMPKGGTLILETANVDLDAAYARTHASAQAGPHVLLAVSDTGHGMDAETLARIFEPFFTTKEPGKGTGLGLATVYGILKQSGGHINVYSEAGRGTSFKVYLPRVEEAAEDRGAVAVAPGLPPSGSETLLLVEDAEALRMLIREVLETAGYHVLEAVTPDDAISVSSTHSGSIDLLVTDVVMPGLSGRDLAAKIGASRSGIRVLFISGYTDEAIVHHGVLDRGTNFLQKPFTSEALLRKVREVLDAPTEIRP